MRPQLPPGYEKFPSSRPVSDLPPSYATTMPTPSTTAAEGGEGAWPEKGKAAAEEEEEGWVELERPEAAEGARGGEEESGFLGDNIMVGEVDINTKGWQIVSNTTK